jgi:RNA polymerase sigma-70 factor (ECF subfamily)
MESIPGARLDGKIPASDGHGWVVRPEPAQSESFRTLFEAHVADLWKFARRRTDSAAEADDVVSQVFAIAWRRRDDLPESAERLWLFGVARRVLANDRRSKARQERLALRLVAHHRPDGVPSESEDLPALSLAPLTDDEREAVQLRYWDDLSVTDIAALLGCTTNAVSMRLHKARRKLLDRMEQKDPIGGGHASVDPDRRTEDRDGRR